ncbi:hypothetical protein FM036_43705 [Nostoc sp. HG1]|nr:hypothetical protein [Nostoc sp. HG1]
MSIFKQFGARIYLESDVPPGAGVSSSAALEVAVLAAIARAFKIEISGAVPRVWPSKFEKQKSPGAPCGVMDQLTVALGRAGQLLRLKCQPDIVEGWQILPTDVQVWGIDSGVKHTVGGNAYTSARVAA